MRLYRLAARLADPVSGVVLAARRAAGKEDPARIGERQGVAASARPEGPLVWLHGASIGEARTALPVIAALARARPEAHFLLTSGTLGAARALAGALPPRTIHQFAPVDTGSAVRRFLDHWRPDLALWIESEIWPELVSATASRGVPMALINARLSERSAGRWEALPGAARSLFGAFRLIEAQDGATAARLARLVPVPDRVRAGGNLKSAVEPPAPDPAALSAAEAVTRGRPVWLAASTHAPEEEAVAAAQAKAAETVPGLLTLLAPRHPDRADAIAAMLAGRGISLARRSRGEAPGASDSLWLLDTFGELGLWYRVAPVAFVGGSLTGEGAVGPGGHTPFEPAALGSAILAGPEVHNFAPAYAALADAGAYVPVRDAAALAAAVARLIGPDGAPERRVLAARALAVREASLPDLDALAGRLWDLTTG